MLDAEGHVENGTYTGAVTIRNVGFARPINPREIYLVLFDRKGNVIEFPLNLDARMLGPWEEVAIPFSVTLPDRSSRFRFKSALWLPDEAGSIRYNPAYAITIAEGTTPVILGRRLLNVLHTH